MVDSENGNIGSGHFDFPFKLKQCYKFSTFDNWWFKGTFHNLSQTFVHLKCSYDCYIQIVDNSLDGAQIHQTSYVLDYCIK